MSTRGGGGGGGNSDNDSVGSSVGSRRSVKSSSRSPSPLSKSSRRAPPATGAVNKVKGNALDAANLRRLELQIELLGDPDFHLDYPCKDRSRGVNDFSSWSYFKRPQFHVPPVNAKSSFLWNDKLVERVNKQREYVQAVEEPKLIGYRETQQNLARKKRAKKMLAIWKKTPVRSLQAATDGGALTGRTDVADLVSIAPSTRGRGISSSRSVARASAPGSSASARGGSRATTDRSLSRGRK